MQQEHAEQYIHASENHVGMDIVIISTSTERQAEFWEKRMPSNLKSGALVVAVAEDWPNGAGNGLGTLYAVKKAREKEIKRRGHDLLDLLRDGKSIAVYHAAGEGKRLAPLSLSEFNNKAAVKLPGKRSKHHPDDFLTILEAVVKQTSLYSTALNGRVSVFWSDQVFIPSKPCAISTADASVILFTKHIPEIDREIWERLRLNSYGVTIFDQGKETLHEKTTFDNLLSLSRSQNIQLEKGIGLSMGSFSLSYEMTIALLSEFETELNEKKGKMDTDTDFWMALTLNKDMFHSAMQKKGVSDEDASSHFRRMQKFKERFSAFAPANFFKTIDIGKEAFWWDFGTLSHYYHNNLKMTRQTPEGQAMRTLYLIEPAMITDEGSCLVNCDIKRFKGKNSVLAGVKAEAAAVGNALILNTHAPKIEGEDGLLYDVHDNKPLTIKANSVRADIVLHPGDSPIEISTQLEQDGKKVWNKKVDSNLYTYEEISNLCREACEKRTKE